MKKKLAIYIGIIIGFLVLAYAFVPQVLGGKIINQADISGYRGMAQEMTQWNKEHPNDKTAWTESMFGGMPTASINPSTEGDYTWPLYKGLMAGKRPANWLFVSLLGGFLLMLVFGVNPLIAAGGAIAITFCSFNFQIIQVGHNTKMQAIALMPWVLAALVFAYKSAIAKKWPQGLLGAALFGLAVGFQVKANHPQISYYLALIILFYVVTVFIWLLAGKKESGDRKPGAVGRFFAISALLLVLGLAGIGTNASKLLPTFEYTPYSMRGGSTSGETKGLDLDYATAWSYGWEELPNLMIPNFNGGASAGALGPDSQTVKLLKRAGQPNIKQISKQLPLYWGPQPFTAGPMFIGGITIFLFLLGLFCYKGKERWWLLAATLFAVLLALGHHFMWFTRLCYNYLPLYNKFRTVSMALCVLQVSVPLLGFIFLDRLVREEIPLAELKRKGLIAYALTGGICLIFWLFPGLAGGFTGASDAGMQEALVDALVADRISLLRHDAGMGFLLISAAAALIVWACLPGGRGRRVISALAICTLVLVNMFAVGKRYLNADDFVTPKNFMAQFAQRPVDKAILADPDPSYRVLDLTVNVFNDSHPSYWHKNIGGYSPAKLQIYQEYIESHLQKEIGQVGAALKGVSTVAEAEAALPYLEGLAKLNCRYIIVSGEAAPLRYPFAKGNAWFEEDAENEFVRLTSYAPNCLRYEYSAASDKKLIFSEVWYPAGWVLHLEDGSELPMELSDEVLRSAMVPAGEHTLEMRFEPVSYARGTAVSRLCSILLLLLAIGSIVVMCLVRKSQGVEI
ncbi:MAG: hypothetical protein IKX45_04395 [Bacteroidales bacterium]|nr:hypothetical protein [Bacteroidales bacterium]